jgi:hypothetical protein
VKLVANDDEGEGHINITKTINAGNNNNILYRQTTLRSAVKSKHVGRTATSALHGQEQLNWQRISASSGGQVMNIPYLIEFYTVKDILPSKR